MTSVRSLAQQNHAFNATKSEQGYVAAQQQPVDQPPVGTIGVPPGGPTDARPPPGDWQVNFWDCWSPTSLCCEAFWCPCILYGKTRYRLEDPSLQSYQIFNKACMSWYALSCLNLQWAFQMSNRREIRERYNIEGSNSDDCLRSYCCGCCELMQEEKEICLRTQGLDSTVSSPGYQKQEGMTYGSKASQ